MVGSRTMSGRFVESDSFCFPFLQGGELKGSTSGDQKNHPNSFNKPMSPWLIGKHARKKPETACTMQQWFAWEDRGKGHVMETGTEARVFWNRFCMIV